MNIYYSIDGADGTRICSGLQLEHKAREAAQRHANESGAPVLLYSSAEGDEGELIEPERTADVTLDEAEANAAVGEAIKMSLRETRTVELQASGLTHERLEDELFAACGDHDDHGLFWGDEDGQTWQIRLVLLT